MKPLYIFIFLFSLTISSFAQDFGLPNYMTEDEKKIGNNYESLPQVSFFPPATPVRTMAEWEELDGIIITWTSYTVLLRQIVDAAQEEGKVWIICSDSNSVKSYLTSGGVPLTNCVFYITSFNSVWCRDYGPWCVYSIAGDTLGLVDLKYNRPRPLDDVIPGYLAAKWGYPLYQTISGRDSLAHTGGNFMVDGFGTSFRSRLTEIENPWWNTAHIDSILFRYCGIQIGRSISMTVLPYDGIHHIDMHMKLLDEETLMIGQYPTGIADGPQIELNIQYIQNNYMNCYGRPYKIVRIPMPPSPGGQYPPNSSYYTYTNSVIINKTVLVPIYGFALDAQALQIYRTNMPGYNVIGYDCNVSIGASGAIHCITKEIGTTNPVLIKHARLMNTTDTVNNYVVTANIKNKYGIDSASVYWTIDTTQGYTKLNMTSSGGQNWTASIPHQSNGKSVFYYIKAKTSNGKYFSKPITAPRGNWRFYIGATGISQNGNSVPEKFELYQNYPNPFNPVTIISFDIPMENHVTLKIYDITGREIKTILNGIFKAGSYKVDFDGANLSSGVYFYRIEYDGINIVKKMLMVK